MRIVARNAAKLTVRFAKTPAQLDRRVMLQQIGVFALSRQSEDRNRLNQPRTRPEIRILPPRQQHPRIAALMALHANVLGQPRRQPIRIHDRCVRHRHSRSARSFGHMQRARPMAVLAPDGKFAKRRILEQPIPSRHRFRPPRMTHDTVFVNRPVESFARLLIARRKIPALGL